MRVAIVGGTVFIGRAIVTALHDAGHEVCVVHRGENEPDDLPAVTHVHTNRDELGAARDELRSFAPDVVVDNIAAVRRHAETVVEAFGDVRYVVISSMDVYRAYGSLHAGVQTEPVPIDETSPVREERYPYRGQIEGMDDYEWLDVEEVYASRGATILRLPMVYGPRDRQRREEPVLRRVRAGRDRIPVGSGTWLGTKGFVDDAGRGVCLAVESEAAAGEVFNLGESVTYPMGMWARMILDAAASGAELVRVPDDRLPPDLGITGSVPQHLLVSSAKARAVLGFSDTPAADALKASVAWHLADPPEGSDEDSSAEDFSADDTALAGAT